MTILDTFYILFKSNAKEAIADNNAVDKNIAALAAKGKSRSDDENKQLKELRKQRAESARDLKDQGREAEKAAASFTKLGEGVAAAVTAYIGFAALKAGIVSATDFNSKLKVQSDYLGQSAQDIYAYGEAVAKTGGSVEAFQATVARLTDEAQRQGKQLPPLDKLFESFHKTLSQLPADQARLVGAEQMHLDQGTITLLMQKGDAYKVLVEQQRKLAPRPEDLAAAREFDKQWETTTQTFQHLFTELATDVLPALSNLLKMFNDFVSGNPREVKIIFEEIAIGVTALSVALTVRTAGIISNLAGIGAAAKGLGSLGLLGRVGAAGAGVGIGLGIDQGIVYAINKLGIHTTKWHKQHDGGGNQSSLDFWMAQGYSREQAAGLVANEMAESGGNPTARGDGGQASGLFQWHPDRAAKILAGTGIDVRSAGHEDQLKAAAWELQQRGQADQLKKITDAYSAGAFVSNRFEVPADRAGEAVRRGQSALSIASSSSLPASGGNTIVVKTGDIHVNTQATDADGIAAHVGQSLQTHIRSTISNYDDGVLA